MAHAIRIAIAGVGNCASSLLQGIEYYRSGPGTNGPVNPNHFDGLLHREVGGYRPEHIRVVAAFDVDARKVGQPLQQAMFAPPNCTAVFCDRLPDYGVTVQMGPLLDGVAPHMADYGPERTFVVADAQAVDVAEVLRRTRPDILLNYLPVGSEQATRTYAQACLETGVSLINCIPVFIVSNASWAERFRARGIPVVGDDIKSQFGATITHRTLAKLCADRGVKIERTYQLNTGGNTDFLNMLSRDRLTSKRISKTEAVQSQLDVPLAAENIHIGPSDYVPWQKDQKVCFLRIEGTGFGGCPISLELRLSVEDSPNSAGVSIDAIRVCKLARDRGMGGALLDMSAWCMKHPPVQLADQEAKRRVEAFIAAAAVPGARPSTRPVGDVTATAVGT